MYALLKPLLFRMNPEKAHHFTTSIFVFLNAIPGFSAIFKSVFTIQSPKLERTVFGIKFSNPVGLAAGFDKQADLYNAFSNLGFGFIEVGTITPKAQDGNPKPRMFRLVEDEALINRMGFNNQGLENAIANLKKRNTNIVIGGNIGKNKITPNEKATDDYIACFEALFPYVDYFVVNVSSPNTPNLRELQDKEPLTLLLNTLQECNNQKNAPKPILLKIAPDLSESQLDEIVDIVKDSNIAGVVASNTTIERKGLKSVRQNEMGGLSGKPLTQKSTEIIRYLHAKSNGAFPIIGVGGIMNEKDAIEKLEAGASLIQLYTGFIYGGPALVKKINKAILHKGL